MNEIMPAGTDYFNLQHDEGGGIKCDVRDAVRDLREERRGEERRGEER